MPTRCAWVSDDSIYIDYHDNEWGVPVYDSQQLFTMLLLEGMQAGLNWLTILKSDLHFYRLLTNLSRTLRLLWR